jgi:hypothetical protein
MVSGALSAQGSDLATGTTAPGRVRRRWPILDVHDVKQRNAILPRAPKRCASASNFVMHARQLSRGASGARRYFQRRGARTGNPERTRTHARQAETFVVV